MKSLKSKLLLGLVCLVLGLMLSFQFRITNVEKNAVTPGRTQDSIAKEIDELTKQKQELGNKVEEYQKKVDEYEKSAASVNETAGKMKEDLDSLRVLAGLTDVEGKGVVITISPIVDVTTKVSSTVLDNDVLSTVNELLAAGAEAISINDERYVSNTPIREAGKMIKVNSTKFDSAEPFVIKAIGNPKILEGAFKITSSVADKIIQQSACDFKIEKQDKVKILKYSKNVEYKYIKVGR
ncbi:DUF881 domain-containing protein [Clostridium cylindrosporum]|uniref:Division initiation protein n=1 Tax=Clostridium cylindrosporum DSM 605 TaxID=1121307 RepID=A0A0J8DAT1_CLOCY|nr:DUF881 domain-containing protein [Clostridium cylindrosporum]KMT21408.1 hypothetical protein CLCY_2c01680 [Clostridium cylindrosporum DSM 605]